MAKQQQATPTTEVERIRVVVRGTDSTGKRVRRVRTIDSTELDNAGEHAKSASEGLDDVYFAVYPPVGFLCKGNADGSHRLSRDWVQNPDGSIERKAVAA